MPTELTMNLEPIDNDDLVFRPTLVKNNERKLIYILMSYDDTNNEADPDDKGFVEGVFLTLSGAKDRIQEYHKNGDWAEFNILAFDMTTGKRVDVIYQKRVWSDDGSIADA